MSYLRGRSNTLNRFFFQKFQQQVSQAPGFKPLLSYEDFLKILEINKQAETPETPEKTNE